ncbi:MAG: MerR family transcriptional regulator [Candidatus Schekmanbacteria bacterium]|nr:MerR family transcriptional regulator [Candidatus Schekmanbacteria bacterium]
MKSYSALHTDSPEGPAPPPTAEHNAPSVHRISDLVAATGLSKEIIHHYLRADLLPRSPDRGRYSGRQVRLLRLIRKLREEHGLALETIRALFGIFSFDPDKLEPLVLGDSLAARMTRLAESGHLQPQERLSAQELATAAGVGPERITEYLAGRLICPRHDDSGGVRFSRYDANIIQLCEYGQRLGMPYESFQTISSFIRIAFELEHAIFLRVRRHPGMGATDVLAAFFTQREIASSFIDNVLQSLIHGRLRDILEHRAPAVQRLDDVLYCPSPLFRQRYGLEEAGRQARERVGAEPANREAWRHLGAILLHGGQYREATFFLERAHQQWPDDGAIRLDFARAVILAGDRERARLLLAPASTDGAAAVRLPLAATYLALAMLAELPAEDGGCGRLQTAIDASALLEAAAAAPVRPEDAEDAERCMLCGWLLTALPPLFRRAGPGSRLLAETLDRLQRLSVPPPGWLPGQRERYLINCSYLLFDVLERCHAQGPDLAPVAEESLRTTICRLDPGCRFAQVVFLAGHRTSTEGESHGQFGD